MEITLPVIHFLSSSSAFAKLFNYFFSIPFWAGVIILVPALCVKLISRS